jgi:hypothetical protein
MHTRVASTDVTKTFLPVLTHVLCSVFCFLFSVFCCSLGTPRHNDIYQWFQLHGNSVSACLEKNLKAMLHSPRSHDYDHNDYSTPSEFSILFWCNSTSETKTNPVDSYATAPKQEVSSI